MAALAINRRAMLVYHVKPNFRIRLKLSFTRRRSLAPDQLGFQGVFGHLGGKELALKSLASARVTSESSVISLNRGQYMLVVDAQGALSQADWKVLLRPSGENFLSALPVPDKCQFVFHATPVASAFIAVGAGPILGIPEVDFPRPYQKVNVAKRIACTLAIEKFMIGEVRDLGIGGSNLPSLNRLVALTNFWQTVWASTGGRVPLEISKFENLSLDLKNLEAMSAKIAFAIKLENRRIVWAAGSAVAVSNLAATTIPDENLKWLAWVVFFCVGFILYVARPFSRR